MRRQTSAYPPSEAWGWMGMWLSEEEAEDVLTATMRGFLSANAEQIQEAARRLKRNEFCQ